MRMLLALARCLAGVARADALLAQSSGEGLLQELRRQPGDVPPPAHVPVVQGQSLQAGI